MNRHRCKAFVKATILLTAILLIPVSLLSAPQDSEKPLRRIDGLFNHRTDMMMRSRVVRCPSAAEPQDETTYYFRRSAPYAELLLGVAPSDAKGVGLLMTKDSVSAFSPDANAFFSMDANDSGSNILLLVMLIINGRLDINFEVKPGTRTSRGTSESPSMTLGSKSALIPYPEVELTTGRDIPLPVEAAYRTVEGEKAYTIRYLDWVERNGVYFPHRIAVFKHQDGAAVSSIEFDRLTAAPLPEFIFTRAYCEYMGN